MPHIGGAMIPGMTMKKAKAPVIPKTKPGPSGGIAWVDQRRLCVEAGCDPRTLTKYLRGQPVTGVCAQRIRKAMAELGLEIAS